MGLLNRILGKFQFNTGVAKESAHTTTILEHHEPTSILIDTPGLGVASQEELKETIRTIIELLKTNRPRKVFFVLMLESDRVRVSDKFIMEVFLAIAPAKARYRIIFNRVDPTFLENKTQESCDTILTVLQDGLPVATGQDGVYWLPEDSDGPGILRDLPESFLRFLEDTPCVDIQPDEVIEDVPHIVENMARMEQLLIRHEELGSIDALKEAQDIQASMLERQSIVDSNEEPEWHTFLTQPPPRNCTCTIS